MSGYAALPGGRIGAEDPVSRAVTLSRKHLMRCASEVGASCLCLLRSTRARVLGRRECGGSLPPSSCAAGERQCSSAKMRPIRVPLGIVDVLIGKSEAVKLPSPHPYRGSRSTPLGAHEAPFSPETPLS